MIELGKHPVLQELYDISEMIEPNMLVVEADRVENKLKAALLVVAELVDQNESLAQQLLNGGLKERNAT